MLLVVDCLPVWRYRPGSGVLPHKLNMRVTTHCVIVQCKELENVLSSGIWGGFGRGSRGICCQLHLLKVLALTCSHGCARAGSVLWGGFCWVVGTVGIDTDKPVYVI